jgi:hypothetical protein
MRARVNYSFFEQIVLLGPNQLNLHSAPQSRIALQLNAELPTKIALLAKALSSIKP